VAQFAHVHVMPTAYETNARRLEIPRERLRPAEEARPLPREASAAKVAKDEQDEEDDDDDPNPGHVILSLGASGLYGRPRFAAVSWSPVRPSVSILLVPRLAHNWSASGKQEPQLRLSKRRLKVWLEEDSRPVKLVENGPSGYVGDSAFGCMR
jgi:hypothetical protein